MRSCAVVRLEGDAAALKARPLRVQQTTMLTKRKREVAAAEFFDLRLLQSRHQSFAAINGGLELNSSANQCTERELIK